MSVVVAETFKGVTDEARRLDRLIKGKTVSSTKRFNPRTLFIEFEDGTRLYVDMKDAGLELSVTKHRTARWAKR